MLLQKYETLCFHRIKSHYKKEFFWSNKVLQRFKKENEYLDIHKTGIYKKNPVIIELETRDLLTYLNINDIKTAFTKKQKL